VSDPVPLLQSLVSYRSDALGGDEAALADHLERLLRARGPDEVVRGSTAREGAHDTHWVFARWGTPRLLLNAHLDTVPVAPGWTGDPFTARIDATNLTALGSADTKGAAAAILAALDEVKPRDVGVLFSGDEERSTLAMRHFLATGHWRGAERAIVCEPTSLRVGMRHRGIVSFEASATSPGGHSSRADALPSPIATLARLCTALDARGFAALSEGPEGFKGLCLNLAKIDGGTAFNIIPSKATLHVSLRPPPGASLAALRAELVALARKSAPAAELRFLLDNEPFLTRDPAAFVPLLGEPARAPIDLAYWTEAALLSAAGVDAVVFGPGDIAVAHAPDEFVPLAQLREAARIFAQVFASHGAARA
jgi:acetylornithine deacetylase